MIKSIFIEHFRSCNNINFDNLNNVLIVIGRNGVGKTNIFRAIEWVAETVRRPTFQNFYYDPAVGVKVVVEVDGLNLEYFAKCSTYEKKIKSPDNLDVEFEMVNYAEESLTLLVDSERKPIFERFGDEVFVGDEKVRLKIGNEATACAAILTTQPMDVTAQIIMSFYAFMRGVSYNHLDTLAIEDSTRAVFEKDYLKWCKNHSFNLRDNFDTEMQLLDLSIRKPDKFIELKNVLCHLGIICGLDINSIPTGDSNNPKVYFYHWYPSSEKEGSYSWSDLSYGTRRLVKLFVSLFYKEDKVFMIEQPEDGIHAGLLHQILPMLREYSIDKQIFIATHSPQILNRANPQELRLIYKEDGLTCARELSEDELSAAADFLNEEGSLFDFLSMIES